MKKHQLQSRDTEHYLLRIPILGYILRKIRANRQPIETTLRTGKETKGEVKKQYFLGGLFGISSGKRFKVLKLGKRKND